MNELGVRPEEVALNSRVGETVLLGIPEDRNEIVVGVVYKISLARDISIE